MSRYVSIAYHHRVPHVKVQHTFNEAAPPPVTPVIPEGPFEISGTITSAGTGGAYEITANGSTWFSAASGSYGYMVPGGWSGSTVPTWVSDPPYYTYISVVQDYTNQNFDIPVPFLTYDVPLIDWSSWAYSDPVLWQIATSPDQNVWTFLVNVDGADRTFEVSSYGTYYSIFGVALDGVSERTPRSNPVLAEPPDITYTISGSIWSDSGPLENVAMEFEFDGTVFTDIDGNYAQDVPEAYSGTVTPHFAGGTFEPQVRVYTNVQAHTPDQDYVFTFAGTGTVVYITLSGSVFYDLTGEGITANLWVDTVGTISTDA